MSSQQPSTFALVLCAHPDDAELACSGTIKNLTRDGHHVAIVDCTEGEMGTRGSVELRYRESVAASNILGIHYRENLHMPDGFIEHTNETVALVAGCIRYYRPHMMLIPPPIERHPDHQTVHSIARAAAFVAGLSKYSAPHHGIHYSPHRPTRMLCFLQQWDFPQPPSLYVDISATYHDRVASIHAYASQFYLPDVYDSQEPSTFISRPGYLQELEARARYFGSRIGTEYAEAFLAVEPIAVHSLTALL
jgi:N-acetylglucosamine malate deacetylase 1